MFEQSILCLFFAILWFDICSLAAATLWWNSRADTCIQLSNIDRKVWYSQYRNTIRNFTLVLGVLRFFSANLSKAEITLVLIFIFSMSGWSCQLWHAVCPFFHGFDILWFMFDIIWLILAAIQSLEAIALDRSMKAFLTRMKATHRDGHVLDSSYKGLSALSEKIYGRFWFCGKII